MRTVMASITLLALLALGCTIPVYNKTVITRYDAQGKLVGTEVHETIAQQSPYSAPFKINLEHAARLETQN